MSKSGCPNLNIFEAKMFGMQLRLSRINHHLSIAIHKFKRKYIAIGIANAGNSSMRCSTISIKCNANKWREEKRERENWPNFIRQSTDKIVIDVPIWIEKMTTSNGKRSRRHAAHQMNMFNSTDLCNYIYEKMRYIFIVFQFFHNFSFDFFLAIFSLCFLLAIWMLPMSISLHCKSTK